MRSSFSFQCHLCLIAATVLLSWSPTYCAAANGSENANESLWRVTFTDSNDARQTIEGRLIVEAVDGGLLIADRGGALWNITPDRIISSEDTNSAYRPFSRDEARQQLREEFGEQFAVVTTKRYVICSAAGRPYAKWCGMLFERLFAGFYAHWNKKPLDLRQPSGPLVAIVFANHADFAKYATRDAGPATARSKGYYSTRTNRIVLYDLTSENKRPARTIAEINQQLGKSLFNVATVVHEATHQIAFNCGLHTRYADNPLWLTEGMAMYFETPDAKNRSGWRTIGKLNPSRLRQFQKSLTDQDNRLSLESLIATDDRFQDPEVAAAAYAESWALSYFLIKTRRQQYATYLKSISAKGVLQFDTREQRLAEFRAAFGDDVAALEQRFARYMKRVGRR